MHDCTSFFWVQNAENMIDDDHHDLAYIPECAKCFNRRSRQILSLRCESRIHISYFHNFRLSVCLCVLILSKALTWQIASKEISTVAFLLHLEWFIFLGRRIVLWAYSIFYYWWIILFISEIPEPKWTVEKIWKFHPKQNRNCFLGLDQRWNKLHRYAHQLNWIEILQSIRK